MTETRTRDTAELAAALMTAAIHVLPLERFYPEVIEIVVVVGGWLGYLVFLVVRDRPRLATMGFRREGLRETTAACFALFALSAAGMAAWGLHAGTLEFNANMLVLAALYPAYGLVQQWLIQGVVARQLAAKTSEPVAVVGTALVFGLLHVPDVLTTVATFLLGLALVPIYLRWRNVWPLGVVHGWLAIPMYFWIAGVDPWARALGD